MRVLTVGRGRMGTAMAHVLRRLGFEVQSLAGRDGGELVTARGVPVVRASAAAPGLVTEPGSAVAPRSGAESGVAARSAAVAPLPDVVLLAVPDTAIADVAARIEPGPFVGHFSGATSLDALRPHDAFSLHPLLTVLGSGTDFTGAYAAIDGSSEHSLAVAGGLAATLGMWAFRVRDDDRAAYHAAASVASNFLVTLEGFAEQLAASAGVPREALLPLAEAALRNWGAHGAAAALTGPIARGDEATVERQRAAVRDRAPRQLALFDALAEATRALAAADPATATDPAMESAPPRSIEPTPATAPDPEENKQS
ncbi:MAG: DUF2520 domain-containing protein [Leucobacter sp.]